ncbi:MAG: 4-hydroxythreonine-4-phosphate dehydrogenase PdxA [Ectothiorhodospiraceae bacterium]|nr:4-hydroxythreonine-4-phosphate dehydrogenase PdxA [Ectothiorhodospiraceae bacterium]
MSTASPLPIALTPGEPAGIGPELVLAAATRPWAAPLVAVGDVEMLRARARDLGLEVDVEPVAAAALTGPHRPGRLPVVPVAAPAPIAPGRLDPRNGPYVLETLRIAAEGCIGGRFAAMVTAPVHKGVINDAGVPFTGHTEYLAELAGAPQPVMLLVAPTLRVALVTTHLPLAAVPAAITAPVLESVIRVLDADLRRWLGIARPRILVCGLNPHAGEGGHLGSEEITVITPTLERLRAAGLTLEGPIPADTAFTPARLRGADVVLAMYHDQGLPVLKHAGFGHGVNVTLGLPFLRTSVDHGTALDLAGTGRADASSLIEAIELAVDSAVARRGG